MNGPPGWSAGDVPGGDDFTTRFQPAAAFKTADTDVVSSTTLVTDPELQVDFVANTSYTFIGFLLYDAATGADIKWTFTGFAGGALLRYGPIRANLTGNFVGQFADTGASIETAAGLGAGVLASAVLIGSLQTFSVGGTMQLQWAQNSSSATPTFLKAQSQLTLIRSGT